MVGSEVYRTLIKLGGLLEFGVLPVSNSFFFSVDEEAKPF
jgi:hypothetical protein